MNEIVELTKELIRFKSVHTKTEEIRRCADFIENFLKAHQLSYLRKEFNGFPSILAAPQAGYAPVLLMSHIDVVDGSDAIFEPRVDGDMLFGRGSIDDKYAAALSLVLLKNRVSEFRREGKKEEDAGIAVLITGDEEVGGHNGVKQMLNHIRCDFCITLDGGSIRKIIIKEKGLFTLKLISRGKASHGSRPWMGENAIEALMDDYLKLKPFFKDKTEDHWHRTMSLNVIRAGNSFNQVPDSAEAVFDIRYTEKDDMDALFGEMQKAVKGELALLRREPLFFSEDSPFLRMLQEVSPESRLTFEHGASDARFLSEFAIPGVVWGADGDQSAHSADEHVNIPSIQTLYERIDACIRRIKKT